MAKSKTKIDTSRGQAAAKASAATKKTASSNPSKEPQSKSSATAPASSDIRQAYKKSLLGKYLSTHRGQPAIKPKK